MRTLAHTVQSVRLTHPVHFDGITFDRLCVREPRMSDLGPVPRALRDEDTCRLVIARLCRVPLGVIRALTPADEGRVLDLVEPMLRLARYEAF